MSFYLCASVYYVCTNFCFAFISIAAGLAHFEIIRAVSMISKGLRRAPPLPPSIVRIITSQDSIKNVFNPIAILSVLSKALFIAYTINMYTWRAQGPPFMGSLKLSIICLALATVFIGSLPVYHIQYLLFKCWRHLGITEYPQIRSPLKRGLSRAADVLVLGGAVWTLFRDVVVGVT